MFQNKEKFKIAFTEELENLTGISPGEASDFDAYKTLSHMIIDQINSNWTETNKNYVEKGKKQAYYFSIEYLPGKMLIKNLINMGVKDVCEEGLKELGFNLEGLEDEEQEAGLGNGGLGRLASCFMDSLSSLQLPGHGYGIRYRYGLFEQRIVDGYQVELPDYWLNRDYMWEIRRPERTVKVTFGGYVDVDQEDGLAFEHKDYETVRAVPYDIPIIGYQNNTVNTLRLWSAESDVNMREDYKDVQDDRYRHLNYTRSVETISQFLYPDDETYEGKLVKLKQQYFLASAGLQDILNSFEEYGIAYEKLPEKVALHINDTHPAWLVPELMRILLDEKGMDWEKAWDITTKTISYTNHTIMSEAMEEWSVQLVKNILPRIYMIIQEINERFCQKLWDKEPGNFDYICNMAIIAEEKIKMAHLAVVGGHSVNGVSELHTEILKNDALNDFYQLYPDKFNNKNNGITHRRWLLKANPELTDLVTEAIGGDWKEDVQKLEKLLDFKKDRTFQKSLQQVKKEKKEQLAQYIQKSTGIVVNPGSIFDIQAKRIHTYKRQLMNVFHIMHLYNILKENPDLEIKPRTFIFAGKAAATYYLAKRIIKLINRVGKVINADKDVNDKLKVVFIPDYSVTVAEKIIPAADVSEQISTASKEASGTGNMKFMMNGALTVCTLDGANVLMHRYVGEDNIFTFGMTADEVFDLYKKENYSAQEIYYKDERIRKVLEQLVSSGPFIGGDEDFKDIYDIILNQNDRFFILKDFDSYIKKQKEVNELYNKPQQWLEKSIVNIAYSGKFSADKTIAEYAEDIWNIKPVQIEEEKKSSEVIM